MIWAYVDGIKEKAATGLPGFCPDCHNPLIPKCGEINVHHWSHWGERNCDPWDEPETPWHFERKTWFPEEWQEVTVGKHRADVKTPTTVIEFQHSSISPGEIREREAHYGDMVWVVDTAPFKKNLQPSWPKPWSLIQKAEVEAEQDVLLGRSSYIELYHHKRPKHSAQYIWRWLRKSWLRASKPLYLDLGWSSDENNSGFWREIKPVGMLLLVKRFGPVFDWYTGWADGVVGSLVDYQVLINSTVPASQRKYVSIDKNDSV